MPIQRHGGVPDVRRQELTEQLLAEWREPHDEDAAGQYPLIHLVEGANQFQIGRRLKIVVVWDAWRELSLPERSAIIMDVFQEAAEEPEDLLRVTLALGLTRSPEDQRVLNSELD